MKAGIISLGCAKNLVDSELVLGMLYANGYEIVSKSEAADVIFINTCGFIQSAKEEAIDTILQTVKSKKPNQKVIAIGCFVERYEEILRKEMPEVDGWISIHDYPHFGDKLAAIMGGKNEVKPLSYSNRIVSTPKYWAYVKIAEGCSNHCAYCAIPLIRGEYHSRKIANIKKEVEDLVKSGKKEIVLIAQDTTRFGQDNGESIVQLLETLAPIPNLFMLRLLYLYPNDVSHELVQVIKKHPNIAPYFDIPMQHGSNHMLQIMNRRGTAEDCLTLMDYIRHELPNAIFRTTVMVGFNHEDEDDFQQLLDFMKKASFDRLGVFKYSVEEDTPAAKMDGFITDEALVENRYEQVIDLQKHIAYRNSKRQIGSTHDCLITGFNSRTGLYTARSYAFAPDDVDGCIFVRSKNKYENGDIVKVKITNCLIYDLEGEVIA